jgi:hypothetical protein
MTQTTYAAPHPRRHPFRTTPSPIVSPGYSSLQSLLHFFLRAAHSVSATASPMVPRVINAASTAVKTVRFRFMGLPFHGNVVHGGTTRAGLVYSACMPPEERPNGLHSGRIIRRNDPPSPASSISTYAGRSSSTNPAFPGRTPDGTRFLLPWLPGQASKTLPRLVDFAGTISPSVQHGVPGETIPGEDQCVVQATFPITGAGMDLWLLRYSAIVVPVSRLNHRAATSSLPSFSS